MTDFRWASRRYSTASAAALACCTDWLTGGKAPRAAIIDTLPGFDPATAAAERIKGWLLDRPGGRAPDPDDDATSLLADWGMGQDDMTELMAHAMAALLRAVADEIAR